jgi:hypothetical protein
MLLIYVQTARRGIGKNTRKGKLVFGEDGAVIFTLAVIVEWGQRK